MVAVQYVSDTPRIDRPARSTDDQAVVKTPQVQYTWVPSCHSSLGCLSLASGRHSSFPFPGFSEHLPQHPLTPSP
ncbi:uncharacterized protein BO72DRAFT_451107 [Aspergillus fijiensis CBS 313.89]|uniref:Uncharacterized protein n=1 Tax=Aspergillus fijiensis CBS 313.89 TaxID=1448319 RepID=A0A8G1VVC3_9EURO|nr:uncharacterized protein BO72DRAFT_451107 [Aspergillus fijiensis CBS 313.89]RAK73997.1 hypothetical protein BO72DRAFT_451107 [Aspergillus fijiensis CBS 313.89]